MAITPEEARKITAAQSDVVKGLEKSIDNFLRECLSQGDRAIMAVTDELADEGILKELRKIYGEAGWRINYVKDQRDGDYLHFLPKKKK